VKLNEYKYTFIPRECKGDFSVVILGGRKLKIHLIDCKGKMNLECYDRSLELIEKGSYINSLDLLKSYYYAVSIGKNIDRQHNVSIKISSYYQPLRDGVWYFYNHRRLVMKKKYNAGILIDSLSIR
jgi:hypothetical protein